MVFGDFVHIPHAEHSCSSVKRTYRFSVTNPALWPITGRAGLAWLCSRWTAGEI